MSTKRAVLGMVLGAAFLACGSTPAPSPPAAAASATTPETATSRDAPASLVSCTFSLGGPSCAEFVSRDEEAAERAKRCRVLLGGTAGQGACPHENVVGSCFQPTQKTTTFFYRGASNEETRAFADGAKSSCSSTPGTVFTSK